MYHICFSNPHAWEISYQTGVYGNKEDGNSSRNQMWGKFIDLTALKTGDKIFFYVKGDQYLTGLFEVADEPYFCQDGLFNEDELYPLRFNFVEKKHYENSIHISELASLIENGQIISLSTFERDVQGSFRGIRQITNDEGQIFEKILERLNPKSNVENVKKYTHDEINDELELVKIINDLENREIFTEPVRIEFSILPVSHRPRSGNLCQYENALQGFIFYCLRRNLMNVEENIELTNFSEALMEFPMLKSQQYRSDILCIYRNKDNFPHYYSFIEIKKQKRISVADLSQLIGYMKTFSNSKKVSFNCIEGVYISNEFDEETIRYLENRKAVEKENPVRLIEYSITNDGSVNFNQIDI